jgi:outer membrane immunogenic protein
VKTLLVVCIAAVFCGAPAFAGEMALKALPPAPASWTGFYVGGDLGGAWSNSNDTWDPLPSPIAFGEFGATGGNSGTAVIGGVHAGYNYQFAPAWVAGVEGDWSWTKAGGSFSQSVMVDPPPGSCCQLTMGSKLDWVSSLRGRFGYLVTPKLLGYATGGVAWERSDYAGLFCITSCDPAVGPYTANSAFSNIETGFTVGGGLEWAMTSQWLLRAEYLYYHFSNGPSVVATPPQAFFAAFPSGFSWGATSLSVVRGGLSYKF